MSASLIITEKVNVQNDSIEQKNTFTETDANVVKVDAAIADAQTDKLVVCAIDRSQLKAVYILSDQDLTLETNNGTTPTDTIALKAALPYIWRGANEYNACLITDDVTALYVTNASGAAAALKLRAIQDATP